MVKKAALATSVYNKATCCNADPKKSDIPIKKEIIANILKLILNSDLYFLISNIIARGAIAKKPTKNLTALNVNGPISSIPVSCAMNVVPHINVHNNALNNDKVFDIAVIKQPIYRQNFYLNFLSNH